MKLYEGMFLLDNSKANKDWEAVEAHVHGILERHGANIKKSQKWGERKLAYEISGHKRGTYMLVHFEANGDAIVPVRRDAGLSDTIIRMLIVIDEDGDELPDILGDVAPAPGRKSAQPSKESAKPARAEAGDAGGKEDKPTQAEADDEKPAEPPPGRKSAQPGKESAKPARAEAGDAGGKEDKPTQAEADDEKPAEPPADRTASEAHTEEVQTQPAQGDAAEPTAEPPSEAADDASEESPS